MSKSRRNPDRNQKLQDYKNKHKKNKQMNQAQQANSPFGGMPEIRQSPTWPSDEMLEISGSELETILNFVEASSSAFMATNAVMSRNIINGKIKLKFEKLNKDTFQYEEMTPEEEAPYQKEVQNAIDAAIKMQKASSQTIVTSEEIEAESAEIFTPPSQEGLPRIDGLVDKHGNQIDSTDKPNLTVV